MLRSAACRARIFTILFVFCWPLNTLADSDTKVEKILSWLGVKAALQQFDGMAEEMIAAYVDSKALTLSQQQELKKLVKSQYNHEKLFHFLEEQLPLQVDANTITVSYQLLSGPLPERARNFDIVMEMPGAKQKFEQWREASSERVDAERAAAISALTRSGHQAQLAALLQTMAESLVRVHLDSDSMLRDELLDAHLYTRQDYLFELSKQLNLYSYRFMRIDEINELTAVFENTDIQQMFSMIEELIQQYFSSSMQK